MENQGMTKKLTQVLKRIGPNAMDDSGEDHVIFWIDVKEMPPNLADPYEHGLQMRIQACSDVARQDDMGRRLRAALKVALGDSLARLESEYEDKNMEQTMEVDA